MTEQEFETESAKAIVDSTYRQLAQTMREVARDPALLKMNGADALWLFATKLEKVLEETTL